jgi:hypothetical protein
VHHGTRRTVAAVVAVALVLGAFAGAFLLSTTSHSDATALRAAAQGTLHAPSHRVETVTNGKSRFVTSEDFVSPDRYRLGGSTLLAGLPPVSSVMIGTTLYSQSACTWDGRQVISWTRQTIPHAARSSNAAAIAADLVDNATDVELVASTPTGDHYMFVPGPARTAQGVTVAYADGRATVANGRLREFSYSERITYKGQSHGGTVRSRFTHYGNVPPIEPPPPEDVSQSNELCEGVTGSLTPATQ